ncbi:MAG: hypothetical protein VR78_06535 [Hoeflea sp. BRH_c9]|nr:MAG: hypothetical protein VR78_06535 [Hoeflea sp. BRH_c9]
MAMKPSYTTHRDTIGAGGRRTGQRDYECRQVKLCAGNRLQPFPSAQLRLFLLVGSVPKLLEEGEQAWRQTHFKPLALCSNWAML